MACLQKSMQCSACMYVYSYNRMEIEEDNHSNCGEYMKANKHFIHVCIHM